MDLTNNSMCGIICLCSQIHLNGRGFIEKGNVNQDGHFIDIGNDNQFSYEQ